MGVREGGYYIYSDDEHVAGLKFYEGAIFFRTLRKTEEHHENAKIHEWQLSHDRKNWAPYNILYDADELICCCQHAKNLVKDGEVDDILEEEPPWPWNDPAEKTLELLERVIECAEEHGNLAFDRYFAPGAWTAPYIRKVENGEVIEEEIVENAEPRPITALKDTIKTLQDIGAIEDAVTNSPNEVAVLRYLSICNSREDLVSWANTVAQEHGNIRQVMDLLDRLLETCEVHGFGCFRNPIRDPSSELQEQLQVEGDTK